MARSPYDEMPAELERRLIRAVGFPELADELDRIAAREAT